ncbi:MAG: hypothetical protein Q7J73_07740 [Dehalococcoidales bacterium]|nr:hypothetical protein [Dehalococcoidales bacterium]
MKRLLELNWEAIAGVLAALTALILHLLHIVDQSVLLPIVLVLLALLLVRDLRRESQEERIRAAVERSEISLKEIGSALKPPEAILVGPSELISSTEQFARRLQGEVVWFNVCLLMFRPQQTFDMLLRPMIENPLVTSVEFISRQSEKERWRTELMPKITACSGSNKVKEPEWCEVEGTVSFILAKTLDGKEEALVSFWGEPFMSMVPGRQIPRYVFLVQAHSGLVARLREIERSCRLTTG